MNAKDEFILSILQCEDKSFNYKSLPSTYVDWSIPNLPPLLKNINEKIHEIIDKYENIQEKDKKILLDIISQIKTERLLLETHPRTFEKINQNDIKLLKETPALFTRKFSEKSNIEKYIDKIW